MPNYMLSELVALSETLEKEYDVCYAEALAAVDPWHQALMTTFNVKQTAVLFPFVYNDIDVTTGEIGSNIAFQKLIGTYVRIAVKKASGGAAINQTDFNDPMMQSILIRQVQGMATQMAYYSQRRLIDALVLGDTDAYYTTYDGQQFFSTTHSINGVSFSNLKTGVLSAANLNQAITNLRRVPAGPNGRSMPMMGAKFHLIIPPDLDSTAKQILRNEWIGDGAGATVQNVYQNMAELHVTELLSDTNDWYVVAELPGNKPFVHIVNDTITPGLTPEMDPTSLAVMNLDQYRWSIKSFEEVFPGQFWLAQKWTN